MFGPVQKRARLIEQFCIPAKVEDRFKAWAGMRFAGGWLWQPLKTLVASI